MQNVDASLRLCLASFVLSELAVVLVRLRYPAVRREGAWLAVLLASFALLLGAPAGSLPASLASAGVLAGSGGLLLAIHRRSPLAWCAACTALAAVSLAGRLAGPRAGEVLSLAATAGFIALSVVPLGLLYLLWSKTGEAVDLALMIAAAAWAVAGGLPLAGLKLPAVVADALAAPIAALVGWTLFEQGYLTPLTSSGYVDRLAAQRRLVRATYARLLASEDALMLQDRLVAGGLLAIGASHEVRGVLAALRAAAEDGLRRPEPGGKDACLRLVLEHAARGHRAAAAFLERIGQEGREESGEIELRELLEEVARSARAAWRPAGIVVSVRCEDQVPVRARRFEVEQVLLNLLRNAAEAFACGGASQPEPRVRMEVARSGDRVLVEVIDNAGGVAPADVPGLFALGRSGRGSTGIGLFLARSLAERNGGSLAYRPVEDGSCFSLELGRAPTSSTSPPGARRR